MIKLGIEVTDCITDFKGIATSRVEYLTGCTQYGVTPKVGDDGKLPDIIYFDESRLDGSLEFNKTSLGGPSINIPERRSL